MKPLEKDLQIPKSSLSEFIEVTKRVLLYLPNVLSGFESKDVYRVYSSKSGSSIKYLRPINVNLFIENPDKFDEKIKSFWLIIEKLKKKEIKFSLEEKDIIDSILYTIQQSIGVGLDLLVNPNSARKHVGNRFEELIKVFFSEIGITNEKTTFQISYGTDEGEKIYKCETDLILSPFNSVKSTSNKFDIREIVLSIKTSSKDRMGKIFIDKILLERFLKSRVKIVGIFLNDVQRKDQNNISFTLVPGLFMVYSKFLIQLEGIYYFDLPKTAKKKPYNLIMKKFSELVTVDLQKLFLT